MDDNLSPSVPRVSNAFLGSRCYKLMRGNWSWCSEVFGTKQKKKLEPALSYLDFNPRCQCIPYRPLIVRYRTQSV